MTVVAAVIRQGQRVLLTQRLPGRPRGLLWEFPGGKVEAGETEEVALRREIEEELGLRVAVGQRLGCLRHHYADLELELSYYDCRILAGKPQALQCRAWAWVAPAEVEEYPLAEADRRIWQALHE